MATDTDTTIPSPAKPCERCGTLFSPRRGDGPATFRRRRFCTVRCSRLNPPLTPERFELMTSPEPNSGCWLWMGATIARPDGAIRARFPTGREKIAARVSWRLYRGPITDGLWVLHKCDNPLCVNPNHLFLGTHQDNMDDMVRKGRHRPPRGSGHGHAVLTEAQVRAIRDDPRSSSLVAKDYGVVPATIRAARSRTWRHVQ